MDVHVDKVLELLHLGEPLLGVIGQVLVLQAALGVKAEEDSVEDVHVDQGARLVRMAVRLLGLVLWGKMKLGALKTGKEVQIISPFQTRLATYLTASK